MKPFDEYQYLDLMNYVITDGELKPDRTDVGSSKFVNSQTLTFDISECFPIPSTRKVAFRIAFEETMFFLRGMHQTKTLEDKNINIWKGNTSREFLDNRGLQHLPEGSMGAGYSHQWRNFGGDVMSRKGGVDQVVEMLWGMQEDPYGRRHIITAWNPQQLHETPLPPCHIMQMYTITPSGKLNSSFVMRSTDLAYGLPYNIMSYAFLNYVFAEFLNLKPGEMTYFGHDCHVYSNQEEMVSEWVDREVNENSFPQLVFKKEINDIADIMNLEWEDVEIVGYDPLPDFTNKPNMAV